MSDSIALVDGQSQAVVVGSGGTTQSVTIAPAPVLQVVVAQVPQQLMAAMADVALGTPSNGDVLRYHSGKWRNYPESDIVIDAENF